MKHSRLEAVILLAASVFLSFSLGWFLRGQRMAQPLVVEAQRTLQMTETSFPAPAETVPAKIDLNTAGLDQLMELPGIGKKRAEDILADRAVNGPFRWPEDLARVKGIGEATVAELLDYITTTEVDVP